MWVDDHDNHNEPDPIPYSNIMVTPNDDNYAKLDLPSFVNSTS